ncbi:MAG: hypothetical protein ACFFBD_21495 [Candidatus Hodarchaeota archaeon]
MEDDGVIETEKFYEEDETLESLETIDALVETLPSLLSPELSLQIITSMLMAKNNSSVVTRNPQKVFAIVYQFLADEIASKWLK